MLIVKTVERPLLKIQEKEREIDGVRPLQCQKGYTEHCQRNSSERQDEEHLAHCGRRKGKRACGCIYICGLSSGKQGSSLFDASFFCDRKHEEGDVKVRDGEQ